MPAPLRHRSLFRLVAVALLALGFSAMSVERANAASPDTLSTCTPPAQGDFVIAAGQTCTFGAVTLSPGARLIVDGTLNANGTTFTEANSGQGWAGIVVFEDATLDFDGATT